MIYATRRVSFTETTVRADFGALGEVEVHSVPTGGTTTDRPPCGTDVVAFPAGKWQGTIRFRGGTESLALTARKNRRVGPSRFSVVLSESRGWLYVDRAIEQVGGSSTFDFEIPPGRAKVSPPKPFSDWLRFARTAGSSPKLTGDLAVDFPGRADVPVLGPGKTRTTLQRSVLNPSDAY